MSESNYNKTACELINMLNNSEVNGQPWYQDKKRPHLAPNPSEQLALIVLRPFLKMIGGRIALIMQETMKNCEPKKEPHETNQ